MGEKEAANYDHLPHPLSRFIGREGEMVQVRGLLAEARLLTLTGTGGSGKTCLAIQIASGLVDEYPNGIWLVELSELSDPAFIQQTIASTLELYKEPGRPLLETLAAWLKPRRALLVMDNCEHLIDAPAVPRPGPLEAAGFSITQQHAKGKGCVWVTREMSNFRILGGNHDEKIFCDYT